MSQSYELTEGEKTRAFTVMVHGIWKERELGLLTREQLTERMQEARDACFETIKETTTHD